MCGKIWSWSSSKCFECESLSRATVLRWHKCNQEGRNRDSVCNVLYSDLRWSAWMNTDHTGINQMTAYQHYWGFTDEKNLSQALPKNFGRVANTNCLLVCDDLIALSYYSFSMNNWQWNMTFWVQPLDKKTECRLHTPESPNQKMDWMSRFLPSWDVQRTPPWSSEAGLDLFELQHTIWKTFCKSMSILKDKLWWILILCINFFNICFSPNLVSLPFIPIWKDVWEGAQ